MAKESTPVFDDDLETQKVGLTKQNEYSESKKITIPDTVPEEKNNEVKFKSEEQENLKTE